MLASVFTAWAAVLAVIGDVPDRYPGDVSFLVPGIAGTLLLYLVVTSPRLDGRSRLASATPGDPAIRPG